jgi:hypothetical protein
MIQRRSGARLPQEAIDAFAAAVPGQKFQSDRTVQRGVERAVHDAHATATELFQNLVVRDCLARHLTPVDGSKNTLLLTRIASERNARSAINPLCAITEGVSYSNSPDIHLAICGSVSLHLATRNPEESTCPRSTTHESTWPSPEAYILIHRESARRLGRHPPAVSAVY